MFPGAISPWLLLTLCSPASRPTLAEVYYDAVGDDTGLEFVEIFNPTGSSVSLSGLRLEAGDGSGPGRSTLRWTGGTNDSVAAGGRFVVGGSRVLPRPQAIVELQLQNGPDAVRLAWPGGDVEVLGYGAQEFPEYACGAPAPDVPSGRSLARIPDDSNLGSNVLDFRPSSPTPGRSNQPRRDVAWASGSLVLVPEQPEPRGSARLKGLITNLGQEATAPREIGVHG